MKLTSFPLLIACFWLSASGTFNTPEYNVAHYKLKREQQSKELSSLLRHSEDMARQIVRRLYEAIVEVLQHSYRQVKFEDMEKHPMNDSVANAFALVIENTPWFLELALLYPDEVHAFMDRQEQPLNDILMWAIETTEKSGFLSTGEKELFLVGQQELNLIPRPPDYKNPHSAYERMIREKLEAEAEQERIRKERRKLKKGPRITRRKTEL